jgi:hypothetical protein
MSPLTPTRGVSSDLIKTTARARLIIIYLLSLSLMDRNYCPLEAPYLLRVATCPKRRRELIDHMKRPHSGPTALEMASRPLQIP